MFNAVLLTKDGSGTRAAISGLTQDQLDEGDVVVRVAYSTLNYKDALAITGKAPVVRKFPMVPGIDFAGTVEVSSHKGFAAGDPVLLNGWGLGETHWGGLSQLVRVSGEKLMRIPNGLTARQAMAIGTAGYTAMLAVRRLRHLGVSPAKGDVLVTGANGGVGSVAILLLAKAGFRVVASTGRPAEAQRLHSLGAVEIVDRASLDAPGKPLAKERWFGVVDCVGSHTLANACAAVRYGGVVAACGLAQGMDFPATVAPFILRGVTLAGIDSVFAPMQERLAAWEDLERELDPVAIESIATEVSLAEAIEVAGDLLAGQVKGRVVVDVNR